MPAYDRSFSPPAPVADVTISHPVTGATSESLRGKLDTGAALTVIPQEIVERLCLAAHRQIWVRGYDGTYSHRLVYYVSLKMEGHELWAMRCLAADRDTVLVGRNVLNEFVLTLDGKNLRFHLKLA